MLNSRIASKLREEFADLGFQGGDPGQGGVEFSTAHPKTFRRFAVRDGRQAWEHVEVGSQSVFPTATGAIFEFGFSDAILQMWAAFLAERAGALGERFGCATPREALDSHRIFAASLRSAESGRAETVT